MRRFETKIQDLKNKVLREVARLAWNDTLVENLRDIPYRIVPGKVPTMRCCVYKERAILDERVHLSIGGDRGNRNVIEVIDIACDECPVGGYEVTDICRGCLAHRCAEACRRDAISFGNQQRAQIDHNLCIECGACAKACPYHAIMNYKRPCELACKVKAISMSESKVAEIRNENCISCGACASQCPFGAISEKSYILDVIGLIQKSDQNRRYKVYAVVAPAIASQFSYSSLGSVVSGILQLGFGEVVEAALGADIVALYEAEELAEKGTLISSCCPAFVDYVKNQFPMLERYISRNLSPMATVAKMIKQKDPSAKVIFIGPCTAKKMEYQKPEVSDYVDVVITFEELQALFDSRDIDLSTLPETELTGSSAYGRSFARSGGLVDAIREGLIETGHADFELDAVFCNGIEECRVALTRLAKNIHPANFIEGMACIGGCIGGAGCLTRSTEASGQAIERYAKSAEDLTIRRAVDHYLEATSHN